MTDTGNVMSFDVEMDWSGGLGEEESEVSPGEGGSHDQPQGEEAGESNSAGAQGEGNGWAATNDNEEFRWQYPS